MNVFVQDQMHNKTQMIFAFCKINDLDKDKNDKKQSLNWINKKSGSIKCVDDDKNSFCIEDSMHIIDGCY